MRPCYHLRPDEVATPEDVPGRIQRLDRELKAELPKEIQRARELGDLRENAEYAARRSGNASSRRVSACSRNASATSR